jgi:predicted RND superfamily exporter protein
VLIGIAVALLVTWLLLIAALVIRGPKKHQLEAAYRRFSPSSALPGRNQRPRLTLLVLTVFVILNMGWLWLLLSRTSGEQAAERPSLSSLQASEPFGRGGAGNHPGAGCG